MLCYKVFISKIQEFSSLMLQQSITPRREIFYAGDSITIELVNLPPVSGRAVFRSNLPGRKQRLREIIRHHDEGRQFQDLDWHDIELPGEGRKRSITLSLTEIGIFEGKCCFIPDDGSPIIWCQGENFRFKVLAASAIGGNTI